MSPSRIAILGFLIVLGASLAFLARERRPGDSGPEGARVPEPPRFQRPDDALFVDDFSSASLRGWSADKRGVWTVVDGMLRARLPDEKQQRSFLRAGESHWRDYAVDLDVCMTRGVDKGVAVRADGENGIGVDLRGPGYNDVLLHRGFKRLGRADASNANGRWHHVRIETRGSSFRVFVNGRRVIEARDDSDEARSGGIALAAYTGGAGKCTVYYDNVVVTPLSGREPRGRRRET